MNADSLSALTSVKWRPNYAICFPSRLSSLLRFDSAPGAAERLCVLAGRYAAEVAPRAAGGADGFAGRHDIDPRRGAGRVSSRADRAVGEDRPGRDRRMFPALHWRGDVAIGSAR